jgi:uncharacterized lipoprotein NlpE involved in copper resistance
MRKLIFLATIVALTAGLVSCRQKDKASAKNTVDWQGIYKGVIPCADCEGIEVLIVLNDSTYQMDYRYIGRSDDVYQNKGTFTWSKDGNIVIFSDKTLSHFFKVGENQLTQLDMEGNIILGEHADKYVLNKVFDQGK